MLQLQHSVTHGKSYFVGNSRRISRTARIVTPFEDPETCRVTIAEQKTLSNQCILMTALYLVIAGIASFLRPQKKC